MCYAGSLLGGGGIRGGLHSLIIRQVCGDYNAKCAEVLIPV